jgi:anti-sigma factor RsiW
MTCVQPGAITPEELVAFVDGEAPDRVVEHLSRCRGCRSEAERYASLAHRLGAALHRFDCPSPQRLGEMELGALPPEERLVLAQHVAECARCADELRTLRAFMADEPAPRPSVVARLRSIVATLVEPAAGLAFDTLRGAGDAGSRTYQAEGTTITLSVEPGPRHGRSAVLGLIAREARADAAASPDAELVSVDGTVSRSRVDDLGSFSFDDVEPGTYRLHLRLGDRTVVVEGLNVES